MQTKQTSRGSFKGSIGFIAAAAGSAVGLGNIWKFPFEVGQGGGAVFILIYLFFCFVFCIPIMLGEICLGRKTQKSPIGAYGALGGKKWKILGGLGVLSGVLILSFYNVVSGWALGYFIEMVQGNLSIGNEFEEFISSPIKTGIYALIFVILTALIVSKNISQGIEKFSKILMPVLIIFIFLLCIYGLTLPNAIEGVKFYLLPDFSKISLKSIYSALGQSFFSLSLGLGAVITYGSYLSKKENILSCALYITLADVGIAFLAGLMLFPIIFSQGQAPTGGAGLIFTTLPNIFANFGPVMGSIIGSVFFLLLCLAALTSTFSLMEVGSSYLVDEFKMPRKKTTWITAMVIFLLGIPSLLSQGASDFFTKFIYYRGSEVAVSFLDFIGHLANDTFLPLGGFLMCIFVTFVWKKENFMEELHKGNATIKNKWLIGYIHFSISILCPIVLAVILLLTLFDRFLGIDLFQLLIG